MPSLFQLSQKESLTPADRADLDALLAGKTVEELNQDLDGGYPVLIYATQSGNIELIAKLLQKGVDKNIKVNVGKYGRTPVMKNALEIAGSTRYRRMRPGGGGGDVKIGVIYELGGADDDSWRKYAGAKFKEAFDDAVTEEARVPVAEAAFGDKRKGSRRKRKGSRRKRKGSRRKHNGSRRKRKGSRRKRKGSRRKHNSH